ncbi:MAG: hypothetical protein HUJ89_03850 [Bacteroidales bacterium]|nr:hypothetical protein [Bacteroidales bacterium]
MEAPEQAWYLMRIVGPRKDIAIRRLFDDVGVRYFQPMQKVLVRPKAKPARVVLKPYISTMFFGYGSVAELDKMISLSRGWLQWVYKRGCRLDDHIKINNSEMEMFMKTVNAFIEGSRYITPEEAARFEGRRVRLIGGALDGVEGVIAKGRTKKLAFMVQIENVVAMEVTVIRDMAELLPETEKA